MILQYSSLIRLFLDFKLQNQEIISSDVDIRRIVGYIQLPPPLNFFTELEIFLPKHFLILNSRTTVLCSFQIRCISYSSKDPSVGYNKWDTLYTTSNIQCILVNVKYLRGITEDQMNITSICRKDLVFNCLEI